MKSVTPKLKQETKPTHQAAVFSTGILSQSMAFIFKNMKMTRGREGCVYRQVMVDFILKLSSIILYTCKTSIYINAPGKYTTCDRHWIIPARDPNQCGGSGRIVYYNVGGDDDDEVQGDSKWIGLCQFILTLTIEGQAQQRHLETKRTKQDGARYRKTRQDRRNKATQN